MFVVQQFGQVQLQKLFTVWRADLAAKRTVAELEREVRDILNQLDAQGRWVTVYDGKTRLVGQPKFEAGFRFLGSNVFNYHVEILSDYIAATAQR